METSRSGHPLFQRPSPQKQIPSIHSFIHSFIHSLGGLVPLDKILATPVAGLKGDNRNIAVLMRAYHGASLEAVWTDGKFVEPVK
jgi:hypothetical protein